MLQFDGEKSISLYDFKVDPLLKTNLVMSELDIRDAMENKIKGLIQSYNSRMINNRMVVE